MNYEHSLCKQHEEIVKILLMDPIIRRIQRRYRLEVIGIKEGAIINIILSDITGKEVDLISIQTLPCGLVHPAQVVEAVVTTWESSAGHMLFLLTEKLQNG